MRFDWNEKFETGDSMLDARRLMLIAYVNRLHGLWQNTNPSREEVELFVRFTDFLEDYVLLHFREEEDYLLRFQSPAHDGAKMAHRKFLSAFRGFKLRLGIQGYRAELVQELLEACVVLIQQHILRTELQLQPGQTQPAWRDAPE